ncbi:MAG: acyltransferase [Pseudomonadota bacterium]|nr:acyltransferase [Pseudomonadota bacterium]
MGTIYSLQYLRAIAAILVVIFHATLIVSQTFAPGLRLFTAGEIGVDIFFVISGFIMWTIASARPMGPAEFMTRRVARIVPLYWALTIPAALISTDGGVGIAWPPDVAAILKSLFFIPFWNAHLGGVRPVIPVGWTLNLEMLFYAIFALSLLLAPRARLVVVAGLLLLVPASKLVFGQSAHPALELYTKSVVGEFAFGMLLGWAYANGLSRLTARRGAVPFGLALIALAVAAIPFRGMLTDARILHFGVPALMIVLGALCLEKQAARRPLGVLKFLGDASYSIYLAHMLALSAGKILLNGGFAAAHPLAAVAFEAIFACLGGVIVYLVIEKPVTVGAKRLLSGNRASRAPRLPASQPARPSP